MFCSIVFRVKKYLSALLVTAVILTGGCCPAAVCHAADFNGKSVKISTPEELIELSRMSVNETATLSKNFILTADIDLAGYDMKPISILSGTLDGQGHTVTGFTLTDNSTKAGFVRIVTPSGIIKNFHLSGDIHPKGEMETVGGIAGENYGIIVNSSFSGTVLAKEIAGGIAGRNMESGIIRGSVNSASVNATKRTGGVAGFNEGMIEFSENRGEINASKKTAHEMTEEAEEEKELDTLVEEVEKEGFEKYIPDSFDLKDDDILKKTDSGLKINYTGGIAGVCSGYIRNSLNYGTVGYPHNGYKTGGIVGYDRGKVSGCRNMGTVYGRKDIGGIAGQFEPYTANIYSPDALNEAGDALDELTDRTEKLHKDFGSEDDKTQAHIDSIRYSSDELRQVIKDYKEYYRCKDDSVERELRGKTDNLRRILDGIDTGKFDGETRNALQALNDNTDSISKLLDSAGGAAAEGVSVDMTALFLKMSGILATNNAAFDTLLEKAVKANKDGKGLKKDLEELRGASNDLDDYLRGCIDDYKKDFRITGDDLTARTDKIADEADILSEGLKQSDSAIRKDLDRIVESLNSLNVSLDRSYREIQEELQKIYDTDEAKDIFDDVSDDPDISVEKGILLASVNDGIIEGDVNTGGIIGTITDDPDTESDFEVVSGGQVSLNYKRTKKATVIGCRNNGDITVRNSYAGGIVGRADLGAVLDSENYGRIEALEGSYSGGIAGLSAFMIRGCRSKCEAVGSKYAGGIAGLLHSGINNICLSAVDDDKEYHGALAGDTDDIDKNDEDKGTVSGNIFVFRGLGAINGVTDSDKALAVSYEDLMSREGVPGEFKSMTVTFKDNGETVKKIKVPYGGSVSPKDFPGDGFSYAGENSEGKFGLWEDRDLNDIEQDITVNTVYMDYVTAVASDTKEKPDLIVQGRFFEGTTLNYSFTGGSGNVFGTVTFSPECSYGIPANNGYTLRFRADAPGDYRVFFIEGDKRAETEVKKDGEYLVFKSGDQGSFQIERTIEKERIDLARNLSILVILILAALFIFRKKIFKKKEDKKVEVNG